MMCNLYEQWLLNKMHKRYIKMCNPIQTNIAYYKIYFSPAVVVRLVMEMGRGMMLSFDRSVGGPEGLQEVKPRSRTPRIHPME